MPGSSDPLTASIWWGLVVLVVVLVAALVGFVTASFRRQQRIHEDLMRMQRELHDRLAQIVRVTQAASDRALTMVEQVWQASALRSDELRRQIREELAAVRSEEAAPARRPASPPRARKSAPEREEAPPRSEAPPEAAPPVRAPAPSARLAEWEIPAPPRRDEPRFTLLTANGHRTLRCTGELQPGDDVRLLETVSHLLEEAAASGPGEVRIDTTALAGDPEVAERLVAAVVAAGRQLGLTIDLPSRPESPGNGRRGRGGRRRTSA